MEKKLNRIAAKYVKWNTLFEELETDRDVLIKLNEEIARCEFKNKKFEKNIKSQVQKELENLDRCVCALEMHVESLDEDYEFLKTEIEFEIDAEIDGGLFILDEF